MTTVSWPSIQANPGEVVPEKRLTDSGFLTGHPMVGCWYSLCSRLSLYDCWLACSSLTASPIVTPKILIQMSFLLEILSVHPGLVLAHSRLDCTVRAFAE